MTRSLASIVAARHGTAGPWSVERAVSPLGSDRYLLRHYGTALLWWEQRGDTAVHLGAARGHGSVSDQQGFNTACRVLGLPWHYQRDAAGGGPRVELIPGATAPERAEDALYADAAAWYRREIAPHGSGLPGEVWMWAAFAAKELSRHQAGAATWASVWSRYLGRLPS